MYSTSNTHLSLLNLIGLTKLGKDYKLIKLIMLFSPVSQHSISFSSKYSTTQSLLTLSTYILPLIWKTTFNIWTKEQVKLVFFLPLMYLDWKWEGKYSQLSDSKHSKNSIFSEKMILSGPFYYQRYFFFSTLFKDLWAVFLLSFSCFWWQSVSTTWVLQQH